jgi:hypothetical protein
MTSNQRSKRKSKTIEPITFDELRDAAGMSGFVSFLNLPTQDAASTPVDTAGVAIARIESQSTLVDTVGVATTPVEITPVVTVTAPVDAATIDESVIDAQPIASSDVLTTPVELTWVVTTPVVVTPVVIPRPGTGQILYAPLKGGKNLYRCATVPDGHSHLEEALYQLLWRNATVVSPDIRIAQISQSDLARQLRITDKNLRIALERLVNKRSIQVAAAPDFALKTARQYEVYSYRAILERRRDAGLEWVIRNKGVQFVSKQDVDRYREAGTTPVDIGSP